MWPWRLVASIKRLNSKYSFLEKVFIFKNCFIDFLHLYRSDWIFPECRYHIWKWLNVKIVVSPSTQEVNMDFVSSYLLQVWYWCLLFILFLIHMMMKSNIKPSKIDAILIPIIFFVPEMKAELLNARYVIRNCFNQLKVFT